MTEEFKNEIQSVSDEFEVEIIRLRNSQNTQTILEEFKRNLVSIETDLTELNEMVAAKGVVGGRKKKEEGDNDYLHDVAGGYLREEKGGEKEKEEKKWYDYLTSDNNEREDENEGSSEGKRAVRVAIFFFIMASLILGALIGVCVYKAIVKRCNVYTAACRC